MEQEFDPKEVAEFENATWSRCATGYMDGFGRLVGEAVEPLLDAVDTEAGSRILDIGAGPGLAAEAARIRGAVPVGIDFSEAMLAEARRRHPEIEFHLASAESLPFKAGEFDAVIGNFVLHHSGQPEKLLEEAFRVLRNGGKMGFTIWSDLSKLEAFGLFFAAVEKHAGAAELPHGPLFGVSDFAVLGNLAREVGFGEPSLKELQIAWRTDSIDSYLAAFRDWANLEAFPEQVRHAIEETVRERAVSYRVGDYFVMPNPAILISAIK